ncbi:hypothetical protein [Halomonas ventosae]|uniref:Uncharacterized protein n=1 Tax=Halomonas ventosae TaxID=229007 RepID=A0A2T0VL58_9GAMM|nr:hypothetical protein [Halomonas ventosae]PRY70981.1 hypothetical protein BCL64_11081 [Halomonas ventosae]
MPRRPDPFAQPLRDGTEYRIERLEEERERLERRRVWAVRRGDTKAVQRLTERLDALEEAIDADLTPGCRSGRHEWYRRHR